MNFGFGNCLFLFNAARLGINQDSLFSVCVIMAQKQQLYCK
jgi:hypothetical protein